MKIDEFIKNYNTAGNKDEFLEKSIVNKYVPYHEKIIDCDNVFRATTENNGLFKINTPAQFMIFTIQVITRYTDIEKDDNIVELFEKLDELDLINAIISHIPKREFNSYNTILHMIQDDYMENNRNIVSFFETKLQALGMSIDTILETIQNYIPKDIEDTDKQE